MILILKIESVNLFSEKGDLITFYLFYTLIAMAIMPSIIWYSKELK